MFSLAAFVLVAFAAAAVGGRFKPDAWHAALAKPEWNPPNWVFAPVWTVLYVSIAVAGWLLFFGRHRVGSALADLCATIVFSLLFVFGAWSVDPRAAWLFVPYLAWLAFAAALNATIWRLNRVTNGDPLQTQR